jgi:hypothetical protein
VGPCGRALPDCESCTVGNISPLPPWSPDKRGPTLKGYAAGPATKILDLKLELGGAEVLSSVLITMTKSSNFVRSFRLMWGHWRGLRS